MRVLERAADGMTYMDVLLDETICAGEFAVDRETVRLAGNINKRLVAKQKYELMIRIAKDGPFAFTEKEFQNDEASYILFPDEPSEKTEQDGWQTDCYVIGRYAGELKENGCFDAAVSSVIAEAEACGRLAETTGYLAAMIGKGREFYEVDDAVRPILIYKGDPVCHNVLSVFADQFGSALERAGECTEYFDLEQEPVEAILKYLDRRFKAVIGMQSYLFSIKSYDEVHYIHERIHAPQYNFIFDHPVWVRKHMGYRADNFWILTHDPHYVTFMKRYYGQNARLLPPAGMAGTKRDRQERLYDITFVGTFGDFFGELLSIHEWEREERFLANRLLLTMRKRTDLSLEEAFEETLERCGLVLDDEAFLERLYQIRLTEYCVSHYYRYKTIETLLKAGLRVDVFGDSWYYCPLRTYQNLVCHPDVTVEESLTVWEQSKVSLNIMTWHKAGFTERMADIMLAGAVLATDDTTYLRGRYEEEDMIIFRLQELEALPDKVRRVLADENCRREIAQRGRDKTRRNHMWDNRAGEFLQILEENRTCSQESADEKN